MNNKYLTLQEVANQLKISKRSVALLIKQGRLKCLKPSPRKTYVTQQMIDDYANKI